jgi:hypothetical protein
VRILSETHYGRTTEEWNTRVDAGTAFLIERARLNKVTTYTEMNATLARRTGLRSFDFDRADERAAMGYMLGLIVDTNLSTTGLMLSAFVHYLDENDAGPGFFSLAQQLGLLNRHASPDLKMEFWIGQVRGLHEYSAENGRVRTSPRHASTASCRHQDGLCTSRNQRPPNPLFVIRVARVG